MKLLSFLFIFLSFYSTAQEVLNIEVLSATYEEKSTVISLDLKFTNTSDSTLYIVPPKNYTFDKHKDQRNELSSMGLDKAPYHLKLTSDKRCKIDNEDYIQIMSDTDKSDLYRVLIKLDPKEVKTFENIAIDRYDGNFCRIDRIQSASLTIL